MISDIPPDSADWKRVQEAVNTLSEHFDAVHLFCIRYEAAGESEDGTAGDLAFSSGSGSYYARAAFIREWVLRQDERSRLKEREG